MQPQRPSEPEVRTDAIRFGALVACKLADVAPFALAQRAIDSLETALSVIGRPARRSPAPARPVKRKKDSRKSRFAPSCPNHLTHSIARPAPPRTPSRASMRSSGLTHVAAAGDARPGALAIGSFEKERTERIFQLFIRFPNTVTRRLDTGAARSRMETEINHA